MQSQPGWRHIKTSVSMPMGEHMAYLNYRMAINVPWRYDREGMEIQLMSHCYLDNRPALMHEWRKSEAIIYC